MYGVFFVLLCVACIQDVRTGKISNLLVVAMVLTGVFYRFYTGAVWGIVCYVLTFAGYLALLYGLYRIGVLGAGDVKLLAALEGCFGVQSGISFFLGVWVIAAVMAFGKMLIQGNLMERVEYFFSYVLDVVTLRKWQFYYEDRQDAFRKGRFIHMTLPMLLSLILYWGGWY